MLAEKVKSVLDVRYAGFLFREFQSSLSKEFCHEWFDFQFQDLFRDACDNEVIGIAHKIYLLIHAFQGLWARVWGFLAKYPFQSVQRHIGKDRADDTALRRSIVCLVEDGFVHVSCF